MPLVSVIVPVYKAEKYLHKCVDSLLAQTMTDFEVLLINDGSPDRSGAICDEYAAKDSRIRVFHKENGGVSSARNLGILESQGKYITFVDSDDWLSPCYLADFELDIVSNFSNFIIIQGIRQFDPYKRLYIELFSYKNELLDLKKDSDLVDYNLLLRNGCPVAKIFEKI